jgi:hypothetical protein
MMMSPKAERLMQLVRRSLAEAHACEKMGDHTTADLCGMYAAVKLEEALEQPDSNIVFFPVAGARSK